MRCARWRRKTEKYLHLTSTLKYLSIFRSLHKHTVCVCVLLPCRRVGASSEEAAVANICCENADSSAKGMDHNSLERLMEEFRNIGPVR